VNQVGERSVGMHLDLEVRVLALDQAQRRTHLLRAGVLIGAEA
jgi:hypothetical protein